MSPVSRHLTASPSADQAGPAIEGLVERASEGDEEAWHELWRLLQPRLARAVRSRGLGPLSRVDDAVQDTLVAVMAKLRDDGFRRLRGYLDARRADPMMAFLPWVIVVARRAALDRLRADPNYIDLRGSGDGPTGAWVHTDGSLDDSRVPTTRPPFTNRAAARHILRAAGDLLSPAQQRAVELWTEETPSEDIARELGLDSPRAADLLVRAGVERLRRRFRKDPA
jgi:DNA-directed RNA polymerase specialized sigma24 family protein